MKGSLEVALFVNHIEKDRHLAFPAIVPSMDDAGRGLR